MASTIRYAALAAMVSAVYGYSIGEMPSQTIGVGTPFFEIRPTEAPKIELVKKKLDKRALTNTCSEWTLDGLGGTPFCEFSQTCLFTSAPDGFLYEGCGQTSIRYEWVTQCWPWPQTQIGGAPASQTFCPSSAPACGYYAFVYDIGLTFWNFGCSTTSYFSTARLVSTSNGLLGNGGTTVDAETITVTRDPYTTFPPIATEEPTTTQFSQGSSTPVPPNIKKKKVPLGAIIGGVVGGVVLIVAAVLLAWFCIRKKKKENAVMQAQPQMLQQQSDSAFANQQRYSELGAQPKPPAAAFAPPPGAGYYAGGDKAGFNSVAQEYRPHGVEFSGPGSPNPQSPPPVYAQPVAHSSLQPNSPHSNYTELANTGRNSLTPVSPTSLYSPAGTNTPGYNPTSSPSQSHPGTFAPSTPAPPPPSELGANPVQQQYAAYQPNVPNPGTQELNGTGNIPRRPVRQSAAMDMSGNPLNENYHHELA